MVPPPAPPVSPEQVAADLAAFDALESASGREVPPPTGKSKDAIERALILACVPSGDRREVTALMGKIRAAGKTIREGEICTADDIMARCVGPGAVYYTTHFAEDDDGGLTTPPTPQTIAVWIWKFEERRSKRWKPTLSILPRPLYTPMAIPDDVVKLDADKRRELFRQGRQMAAGGLSASLTNSQERHAAG